MQLKQKGDFESLKYSEMFYDRRQKNIYALNPSIKLIKIFCIYHVTFRKCRSPDFSSGPAVFDHAPDLVSLFLKGIVLPFLNSAQVAAFSYIMP